MSAVVKEWAYRPRDFVRSEVVVPRCDSRPACLAWHEFGWACCRADGHGGRHAAIRYTGEVLAVWS